MRMPSFLVGFGARLFTWNRAILSFWARRARVVAPAGIPWAPLRKDPRECTVALVTTAGVHLASDVPFDMRDRRGDATYREIPAGTPGNRLMVTHDYYDHRDADRDINVVFPVDRLDEMAAGGEIGRAAPVHFSFMGHIEEPHLHTLVTRTSLDVAGKLASAQVDLVLLSPG